MEETRQNQKEINGTERSGIHINQAYINSLETKPRWDLFNYITDTIKRIINILHQKEINPTRPVYHMYHNMHEEDDDEIWFSNIVERLVNDTSSNICDLTNERIKQCRIAKKIFRTNHKRKRSKGKTPRVKLRT